MAREIPTGSIEIQTGLYLCETNVVIAGTTYLRRELYSAENYCFYDNTEEIYDDEGNLIPDEEVLPTQRKYAQYRGLAISFSTWTYEQLNARFISVPVQDGFEIVSISQETETI